MIFQKYLQGRGVDTSKEHVLKKTKHIYKAANNVYTLFPEITFESLDFVYNKNTINENKFPIILLTEWMKYVKKGGHVVLSFKENKQLDRKLFQSVYQRFLARYSDLVVNEREGEQVQIVLRKNKNLLRQDDTLEKWTFGIITAGKRNEWVRGFIASVRKQNIPWYEIIIVGTWEDASVSMKDIRYIHFTEKDNLGWITRKKNMIFDHATYQNVFVLHDRFTLDDDWYKNMKKYGNYWDGLFFPIIDKNGKEYVHYSVWGKCFLPIGYVDIRDWGEDYYAGGTFMAIKKDLFLQVRQNEKLFWCEQEDADFGLRFSKNGFVIRPNPLAKIHTFVSYVNDAPTYEYNDQKLGRAVETRGKKWMIIQPIIDVLTRTCGTPFLRARRKLSGFLKKYTNKVRGQDPGGKRD